MKTFILLFVLLPATMIAQTAYRLNINNINLPMDNKGILAAVNIPDPNPVISGSGGKLDNIIFLFSGGFFMSGYSGDSLWTNAVSSASLVEDYLPGRVGSISSDPKNKIYVVDKNDVPFGQTWQNWIDAVLLGADFYDGNDDGIYNPVDLNLNGVWDSNEDKPDLLGDRTAWCVYNDGVPASQRRYIDVNPQGIEIQQTVFAYDRFNTIYNELKNTIFVRYRIKNTGTVASVMDSVIFGIWSDNDIGDPIDDRLGSDTLLNSVFGYQTVNDFQYGTNPPAFYLTYLQCPQSYIPGETFTDNNNNGIYDEGIDIALDTAYSFLGNELGIKNYPGAKNLTNNRSMGWVNADVYYGDPRNKYEARNYLLSIKRNNELPDPCNFNYTNVVGGINCDEVNPFYWVSGDPVTNNGWLWMIGTDARVLANTGNFRLFVNEPIDIIVAYTAARGTDPVNSITVTRNKVNYALGHYATNFSSVPVSVKDDMVSSPSEFMLSQNYPNPFNPITTIIYSIPNTTLSGVEGSRVQLKIYDVLGKEIATLVNEEKTAGSYEIEFNSHSGEGRNLTSGVYFYTLRAGSFVRTKKMVLIK